MATWIVGGVLLLIVAAIVWKLLKDKGARKGGCGCNCSRCSAGCGRQG